MKNKCDRAPDIPSPLRTLIVDDSMFILTGLRRMIDEHHWFLQVTGTATSGTEALLKAMLLGPDLVLMDLQMPGMNGFETATLLRRMLPDSRIIIMTLDASPENEAAARAHGAHGFLDKADMTETLADEIRKVFTLSGADKQRRPYEPDPVLR